MTSKGKKKPRPPMVNPRERLHHKMNQQQQKLKESASKCRGNHDFFAAPLPKIEMELGQAAATIVKERQCICLICRKCADIRFYSMKALDMDIERRDKQLDADTAQIKRMIKEMEEMPMTPHDQDNHGQGD